MRADINVSDEIRRKAFGNVIGSIDSLASFPAQVFRGRWNAFLFFESDRLFAGEFVSVMAGLLNVEQAEICCLLNFGVTDVLTYESAAMMFIDKGIEPHVYEAKLTEGGPAKGWLFGVDRYGSASDQGDWIIYCEKANDIAVIAFRKSSDREKYIECLKKLHAEPIMALLEAGSAAPVPFSQLTKSWCHGLAQHYG